MRVGDGTPSRSIPWSQGSPGSSIITGWSSLAHYANQDHQGAYAGRRSSTRALGAGEGFLGIFSPLLHLALTGGQATKKTPKKRWLAHNTELCGGQKLMCQFYSGTTEPTPNTPTGIIPNLTSNLHTKPTSAAMSNESHGAW